MNDKQINELINELNEIKRILKEMLINYAVHEMKAPVEGYGSYIDKVVLGKEWNGN